MQRLLEAHFPDIETAKEKISDLLADSACYLTLSGRYGYRDVGNTYRYFKTNVSDATVVNEFQSAVRRLIT